MIRRGTDDGFMQQSANPDSVLVYLEELKAGKVAELNSSFAPFEVFDKFVASQHPSVKKIRK